MFDWKKISATLKTLDVRGILTKVRSLIISNWILYLAVFVYIIVLSTITILKNHVFLTSGFDLGIFNQAFHTTLFEGKLFYHTGDLSFNPGGSFFGTHFSPILFLLLPFYAIYPSVENLLVMQTVILALGAFPVFWMSRDKLGKSVGLMLTMVYLVYPPLVLLNLNDFHLEPFISTFFLFSVHYLEQEKWMKSCAFLILSMLTLEFAPIMGVFMVFYGLILYSKKKFKNKRVSRKYLVLIIVLSLAMFYLAYVAKEAANPHTQPLPSPFHYILSNPAGMLDVIQIELGDKIFSVINYLAPLAFLPFLAPEALIMAVPWIGLSFVSSYAPYYSVYFQYTGFVIPFMFVALPKAIERLKLQDARKLLVIISLSTICFMLFLPVAFGSPWNYQLPVADDRTEMIEKILSLVPPDASILTQNDLFTHVSYRTNAYMYLPKPEYSNITVDYILVEVNSMWYDWKQSAYFGDRIAPSQKTYEGLKSGAYGILASAGSLLLLKKGYTGKPVLFVPFYSKCNYQNLKYEDLTGNIGPDPTSTSGIVLNHIETDPLGGFWYGPYVDLLPGLYRVTYVTKVYGADEIISNESKTLFTVDVSYESGTKWLRNATMMNGSRAVSSGQWFNSTVYFKTTIPINNVEFRGYVQENNSVAISLDYLVVEQLYAAFNYEDLRLVQGNVTNEVMTHVNGNGTFWYGPYTSLPKGNYTAKFWLKLDQPYQGTLLDIDVMDNGKTLTTLMVHSSNFEKVDKWQSFDVKFSLQEDSDNIEFRGMNVRETAPVSLLSIDVYPEPSLSQQLIYKTAFNYEDLELVQGNVSNGVMTHVKGNGTFWSGPYASLPKGNYTAKFWLKLDKPYQGALVDIDVSINHGEALTALTVHSSNFEKVDKWQSFDVNFTLQDEVNTVEFRGMNVRETAPISLLAVELYQDLGPPQQLRYKTVLNYEDLEVVQGNVTDGVITHVNGSGTSWSGPYASLPKGNYTAKFWLKLDQPYQGTLLDVDVATNRGKTLAALTVHSSNFKGVGSWQSFDVKFTLQNDTDNIEFRGMNVRETAPISLLAIEVQQDPNPTQQLIYKTTFNYADLEVVQGNVTNGIITHVNGNGTLWSGPYTSLPKGNYIAKFWLKLDKPYQGALVDVDVTTNHGKTLTALTAHSSNFEKVDKWQSFDVNFTLQNDTDNIEFRGMNVRETAPISLLAVELYQDPNPAQQLIYKTTFNYADLEVVEGNVSNGVITHVSGNGTFWHGPYTSLPKGSYTAKFWFKLDKPYQGALVDIDVATNGGKAVVALTVYSSNFEKIDSWRSIDVNFTLQDEVNIVEFRGMTVRGAAPISLWSIEVYQNLSPSQQLYKKTFDHDEGLLLMRGNVSNGVMTHVSGNGTFWNGPYTSLPEGNYTAKFWLKLDQPYQGALLDIDVATNHGKTLTALTVHSSNFKEVGSWQSFDVKFTLQNDTDNIEFRGMNVRETAPVSLLLVEVYSDTGG